MDIPISVVPDDHASKGVRGAAGALVSLSSLRCQSNWSNFSILMIEKCRHHICPEEGQVGRHGLL